MTKFHRHTIQGELDPAAAHAALGEAASTATLLRVETRGGETHIWVATPETGAAPPTLAAEGPKPKRRSKAKVVEVEESDVTKIE